MAGRVAFIFAMRQMRCGGFGGWWSHALDFWIGNAYNDYSVAIYPTTGNTIITGTLAVASTVDAAGLYKRGGVAGTPSCR